MKQQRLRIVLLAATFIAFQVYYYFQEFQVTFRQAESLQADKVIFTYCMIILTFIQLIWYCASLYRAGKLKAEVSWLTKREELQKEDRERLLRSQESLQKKKDMMLNQLKQLQALLNSEEEHSEEAYQFAQNLHRDFQNTRYRHYCSNAVIDAILHSKEEDALAKGISVTYSVSLPKKILLPDPVLICIFFNLLDNAIESCERSGNEKPHLKLEITYQADMMFLRMENSKNPEESFSRQSHKNRPEEHGFGLSIIEDIIRQNDGSAQWENRGDIFVSTLMFHYQQADVSL